MVTLSRKEMRRSSAALKHKAAFKIKLKGWYFRVQRKKENTELLSFQ